MNKNSLEFVFTGPATEGQIEPTARRAQQQLLAMTQKQGQRGANTPFVSLSTQRS
jgi:hypothetical protein